MNEEERYRLVGLVDAELSADADAVNCHPEFAAETAEACRNARRATDEFLAEFVGRVSAPLRARVAELEAGLARYSMDAGHADQCRNVARAAVEALGMDWEETSPNDVTAAIKRLRATPVVGCSGCGGLGVFAGVECRWCAGTGRECS